MSIKLPPVIESYVQANNVQDIAGMVACFTADATVFDDGEEMKGTRDIEAWVKSVTHKYSTLVAPLSLTGQTPEFVVTCNVSGNFDGSPVQFDYAIRTEGPRIGRLAITVAEQTVDERTLAERALSPTAASHPTGSAVRS